VTVCTQQACRGWLQLSQLNAAFCTTTFYCDRLSYNVAVVLSVPNLVCNIKERQQSGAVRRWGAEGVFGSEGEEGTGKDGQR
jgi:hypothetical protein